MVLLFVTTPACSSPSEEPTPTRVPREPSGAVSGTALELPAPATDGEISLEAALAARRSVREFTDEALTLREISQLLWAAQGITADWGGRTAPSAGALYPLEIYLVSADGLSHYEPAPHRLVFLGRTDLRRSLAIAALGQSQVSDAPAVFVIAAVMERTEAKYGDRAERYVDMEAGHACQNLLLQATALGLGAVPTGAFSDAAVSAVLRLPGDQTPLYLVPVGHPAPGST
jgi:SagB-type dehydrogenase family enzyme